MTLKEQFIAELEPLLVRAEKAIAANNVRNARWASLQMLKLIGDYASKMSEADLRDALNNSKANEIAKRLGVGPYSN